MRRPLEECVRKGRIRRGSRRVRIVDLVDELKPWNVGDGEEHDVG